VTDDELTQAATVYFGEPVEAERFEALVKDEPGRTVEVFRIRTCEKPRAEVTVKVDHQLLDDMTWEQIRGIVLKDMRQAITDLRAQQN
jgi:methionine-rich copper-binding protein CopC